MGAPARFPNLLSLGPWTTWFHIIGWSALIGITGVLVHAEVRRPEVPEGVIAHTDLVYRKAGGRRLRLDVYVPEAQSPAIGWPAVLAIHGGGWRGGSKSDYGQMVAQLARHGYVVAAVDYRLSRPGVPSWPDNFEDVREAVRWLRRHAAEYQIDGTRIVALGASAGGHLAALLGTCPEGPGGADGDRSPISARVQAVVDFYGPADLQRLHDGRFLSSTSIDLLIGSEPKSAIAHFEAASPLRHVSSDDPPMLLVHGSDDRLVPVDESEAMASALERAGVPHRLIVVDKARHGFNFQWAERDLLPDILEFLDRVWRHAGSPGTSF